MYICRPSGSATSSPRSTSACTVTTEPCVPSRHGGLSYTEGAHTAASTRKRAICSACGVSTTSKSTPHQVGFFIGPHVTCVVAGAKVLTCSEDRDLPDRRVPPWPTRTAPPPEGSARGEAGRG